MAFVDWDHRNSAYSGYVLKAMAQRSIAQGSQKLEALQQDSTLMALLAVGSVALVVAVQQIFHGHPATEVLYLLPAWMAYRAGGRAQGAFVLGLAAFAATAIATDGFSVASLLLRATAYFAVATAIVLTSERPKTKDSSERASAWDALGQDSRQMVAVMVDCEGFLSLDEYYGNGAGDHVVAMLMRALHQETRESDMVARLGSTEFVLVLADVNAMGASAVMERVQARFEQSVMDAGYECTISFGCSPVATESQTIQDILSQTDSNRSSSQAYLN
jgi:diguanylate cyclase (GGDEF)-like protein